MTQIDNTYNPLAWGSHLAPLMGCLGATVGDILEIGIGHFSTPVLHSYALASRRMLVSVEEDPEWFHMFRGRYECSEHKFLHGRYAELVPELAKQEWGVAFIDNSPGGQRRADDFSSLISKSKLVVVHDYYDENEHSIKPLLNGIVWRVYTDYQPYTLVASRNTPPPN